MRLVATVYLPLELQTLQRRKMDSSGSQVSEIPQRKRRRVWTKSDHPLLDLLLHPFPNILLNLLLNLLFNTRYDSLFQLAIYS